MGKPTGFIEIQRKKQPTRPVAERVQRLARGLSAVPGRRAAAAGRALHGLRHSVLPPGLPARQPDSRLERSRLSRPLARGDRAAARDQQLPGVHRPALPGAVRRLVRARHQRRSGHDQVDRGVDHRSRVRRRLGRAAAAGRRARGRRSRSSVPARPASPRPIS